jgi:hypothetical protein
MTQPWIVGVGIVAIVLGLAYGVRNQISAYTNPYGHDLGRPKIWWVLDDSQLNSRQWLDWGARTTHEPNEPYLKICLRRARAMTDLELQPVIGRVAAHQVLTEAGCSIPPDADRAPPALWLAWCRAAFLKHVGGLWLDGSVLPLGKDLQQRRVARDVLAFGVDPDEGLSAVESTSPMAGPSAGWSMRPHHPAWSGLERDFRALIDSGDASWSAAECRRAARFAWDRHAAGVIPIDRKAEASRDQYGRRLEIDTLLGESEWIGSTEGALWLPLPDGRDKLERATPWLWFLRMSESQIAESKFYWAKLARSN